MVGIDRVTKLIQETNSKYNVLLIHVIVIYLAAGDSSCPMTCISCINATHCTTCIDGYYIGIQENQYFFKCSLKCRMTCISCYSWSSCIDCYDGYYGFFCSHNCSVGCIDGVCAKNGICNCGPGFTGTKCDTCITGSYGTDCSQSCSDVCRNGICEGNETCLCNSNFAGITCEECIDGRYGPNCELLCPDNCKPGSKCRKSDGLCLGECADGKSGYNGCNLNCSLGCKACRKDYKYGCTTCVDGRYGRSYGYNDCNLICPSNCLNKTCNRETGKCDHGCLEGYYGNNCSNACPTQCSTCVQNVRCLVCESKNGIYSKCTRCKEGYYPLDFNSTSTCGPCYIGCLHDNCNSTTGNCLEGCQNGRWGSRCDNPCNDECVYCNRDTGICLECQVGKYSQNCSLICNENCQRTNGHLLCAIDDGKCINGCVSSYKYGNNCGMNCSRNCRQGKCNGTNGNCLHGCEMGYYGQLCDKKCSDNCDSINSHTDSKCYESNGTCKAGCRNGWYGNTCKDKCSMYCLNLACDVTGACEIGCVRGYKGVYCDQEHTEQVTDSSRSHVYIYVAIGANSVLVLLCIVVMITVVIIFKRKISKQPIGCQESHDVPITDATTRTKNGTTEYEMEEMTPPDNDDPQNTDTGERTDSHQEVSYHNDDATSGNTYETLHREQETENPYRILNETKYKKLK